MVKILNRIMKNFNFLRYRFRYLINYMIIGFLAVFLETLIVRYLDFGISFWLKVTIGFISGVLLSFILNSRLNFYVPKSKNTRTFFVFLSIATTALFVNLLLMKIISSRVNFDYSTLRFITAACVFMISYVAHRKITFGFIKKVGIAVYLNDDDVSEIYSKINYYSDFIHIDLVDSTIRNDAKTIKLKILEEIDKTWGIKKIMHIMSKKPSGWINEIGDRADIIIFHPECDEEIDELIELCEKKGKEKGLALTIDSNLSSIERYFPMVDFIQVMGIKEIGMSGQPFEPKSLDLLRKVNALSEKYGYEVIFDGGVKPTNIGRINAKHIVAASSLLKSEDPIKSFLELKTSSRYAYEGIRLREDIMKEIKNNIEEIEFIESGTLVGSFSENMKLGDISDIDIVIIVDKLNKIKFEKIIEKFEESKKRLESKWGYEVYINSLFGPLKFNKDNIVFHVMIYDINSHVEHCKKSPFTCFDWQRSKVYFKKHMTEFYKIRMLQPSHFFNYRRSANEYLEEIKNAQVSYREYKFEGNKIIEEKKYKDLDKRANVEFSYHIVKFLMTNFLKMYFRENKKYEIEEMMSKYFTVFPNNREKYEKMIRNLYHMKIKRKFNHPNIIEELKNFINDFELQFKDNFGNANKIVFIRHQKTELNDGKSFVGQRINPGIISIKSKDLNKIKNNIGDFDLIYSSPLQRCKETSEFIIKDKIIFDDRLKEIDYGLADGKDIEYLRENYPEIIERWNRGEDPRFPDGENSLDVIKRALNFIYSISGYKNKKIVVCTHNALLRNLIGLYSGIPLKDRFKIFVPHFEPINAVLTQKGRVYLELNEKQKEDFFKVLK